MSILIRIFVLNMAVPMLYNLYMVMLKEFNVQLLRFVVVMIRSYSFGHLDSVKWITLHLNETNCHIFNQFDSPNGINSWPPFAQVWSEWMSGCKSGVQDLTEKNLLSVRWTNNTLCLNAFDHAQPTFYSH